VSVMGDDKVVRLSMAGLTAARGFIQSKIAERLDLQYTPVLTFVLDDGLKKSVEAARILRELAEERGEVISGEEQPGAAATDEPMDDAQDEMDDETDDETDNYTSQDQ
jgi:ribosome-binding factor A